MFTLSFWPSYSYQLAAVNPSIDNLCHNLEVGQNLCLGTEGEDCTSTHVVETNDTCDSLYNTYSINSTILFNNNPQLNSVCDNMYMGEVCRLPIASPST